MNAQQEIKDAQAKWAKLNCIGLDVRNRGGYVRDIKDNLRKDLSYRARVGYEKGAGKELDGDMRALHSSSALAANFFDYWTDREDKAPLLRALGIGVIDVKSFDFERKFRNGVSRSSSRWPHLDVAVTLSDGHVIAIEGKFTEPYKSEFSPSYFPSNGGRWADKNLPWCQALPQELHERSHLDSAQLVKHVLGLTNELGDDGFSLYYLYYDWPGEESKNHREEIERFCKRVGGELRFKALTYQQVYREIPPTDAPKSEYGRYLTYLCERYFSGKGAAEP